MKIIKSRNIFSVILIIVPLVIFCLFAYIITSVKSSKIKDVDIKHVDLTYNQVVRSQQNPEQKLDYYKSGYDGKIIFWPGKISARYSQITGIKFCIDDEDHPDIDINGACDWFWASSDDFAGTGDPRGNNAWDGKWVNYILNYYKVPFDKEADFYNDTYYIKGIIKGIDCISIDQCVPDIDIISIIRVPGTF